MIIRVVDAFPLFYRLPVAYGDANGMKLYRTSYMIRITTDDGVEGWGECIDWLPTLHKGFQDRIIPYLIGKEISDRNKWVRHIHKWHARSAAAVSMALTEITAKASNMSLSSLWGGLYRDKVPVYASFQSYTEENDWQKRSVKMVEDVLQSGFDKIKVKIGGKSIAEDQQHIIAVQSLLQDSAQLALDANESYDMAAIMQWQTLLEAWTNLLWIEEPLDIKQIGEYSQLRNRLKAPLAGGENKKTTTDFIPFFNQHALDIVNPDPQHLLGIDGYRETLSLIRGLGIRVSPHTYDGALSRLYAIVAQACLEPWSKMEKDTIEPVEWDVMDNPFTNIIPLHPSQGEVIIPNGSGIGLDIDMELLEFYRWDGTSYM